MLKVKRFVQATDHSCGIACAKMVLHHTGYIRDTQPKLYKEVGATSEGLSALDLSKVFLPRGYRVRITTGLDLEGIAEGLALGIPQIAAMKVGRGYHMVVVTGIDSETVSILDPDPKRPIESMGLKAFVRACKRSLQISLS